jgi:microcystin degradation protein MlrC
MGPSAVVVTDDDPRLAQNAAQKLADMLWEVREQLVINLPDAAEAVRAAIDAPEPRTQNPKPVVLVEMGDNIGGGSSGDSTFILDELLKQEAEGWVVVVADSEAVQECVKAGVRQSVALKVGGKTDKLHGKPVEIRGRVRNVHDGFYEETEARHGGKRYHDQGIAAVVEIRNPKSEIPNLLVLTSKREPPFSLEQLRSLGIKPERQRILVVKAAVAFRAAYQPIAGRIIEVNTPGLTCIDPKRFTYQRVRRPLYGLD